LDDRKKFLAHQPTIGTQSFATAVRRPRGIDPATETTALANGRRVVGTPNNYPQSIGGLHRN
jgi:hypothetical protein